MKGNAEEYAKRKISENLEGYEYAGGYTGSDGVVNILCLRCGCVFVASFVTIRKGNRVSCPDCKRMERLELQERKTKDTARREHERERRLIEDYNKRQEQKKHLCPVCGRETTRRIFCSELCCKKANNKDKEVSRRRKLSGVLVDHGITLEALFLRDKGICGICGEPCDWNDKKIEKNTVICGNEYPSIDHVIPISKGGEHSWANVRLAHRICNSRKRDKYSPFVK